MTVDPVPVVLGVSYHRSKRIRDELACWCHGVDGKPETRIGECDEADGLHDGGVVETVPAHRRVHVVELRIEVVRFPCDERADATSPDRGSSMVWAVTQAACN